MKSWMIKKKSKTGSRAGREHVLRTKALGVSLKAVKPQISSRARGAAVILDLRRVHSSFSKACIVWKQDMHMQGHKKGKKRHSFWPSYRPLGDSTIPFSSAWKCRNKHWKGEQKWDLLFFFFRLCCFNSGGEHIKNNNDGALRYGTDVGIWARRVFSPVRGSLVSTSGPLPALFLTDKTHNCHIHWRPHKKTKEKDEVVYLINSGALSPFTQACFFFS